MTSRMWYWGIDMSNKAARAYAAAVFDEDGMAEVTQGKAILRVSVGASKEQVPILGNLHPRYYQGHACLSGDAAAMFLEYVAPYVHCKKTQVDYARTQWEARRQALWAYQKMIRDSAQGMPKVSC